MSFADGQVVYAHAGIVLKQRKIIALSFWPLCKNVKMVSNLYLARYLNDSLSIPAIDLVERVCAWGIGYHDTYYQATCRGIRNGGNRIGIALTCLG